MVKVVELEPGDVIVARVNVGNMPYKQAQDYLLQVKADIQSVFGTEQKVMLFAAKTGEQELTIVKRK